MLHMDFEKSEKDKKPEEPRSQNKAGSSSMLSTGNSGVLQLIPMSIGGDKRCIETIALCETGSTVSFMDQNLVSLLRLKGKESVMSVAGIHGLSGMKTEVVTANVGPIETETIGDTLTFSSHPNLNVGDKKYDFKMLKQEYYYFSNLPDFEISMKDVKVVLGQDAYHLIRPLENKSGEKSQPWAVKTAWGWTVSGVFPKKETNHLSVSCNVSIGSDPLSEQMRKWWDMETYSSVCNITGKSKEEKRALSILEKTTKHNGERYKVRILWAEYEPSLSNNYFSAYQQFLSTENRLVKDVELKTAYKATIEKDLERNFLRRLDDTEAAETENAMQWYLPHHPVKHPHKPGKVRRVCNAASKFKGVSSNDNLPIGPGLLRNLVRIVFRFREHEVAITADVESIFLQVGVPKEECKCLRFLWRDEPSDAVGTYEYTRHVFGAKRSPICANYGFQQGGRENKIEFPEASFTIDRIFYMDDLVKSVDTPQQAIECYRQLVETLKRSGFTLKKWASNCPEVTENFPLEKCFEGNEVMLNAERTSLSILGLEWKIYQDCLQVCRGPNKQCPSEISQRVVLSFVSSVFDPLGIFAPFTMRMRMLLKSIWIHHGQPWDERLNEEDKQIFMDWINETQTISDTSFPRRYFSAIPQNVQLHIFCDASLEACVMLLFLQAETDAGNEVSIVLGRCRIAPIKQLSIPCLELQAALHSVRLRKLIVEERDLLIDSVTHWTDSNTALQWLHSADRKQNGFVANRAAEILEASTIDQWKHIKGELNPSDIGTRGITIE